VSSVSSVVNVASNLAKVRERIAQAARRAGRRPDEIALMAVSKTFPAEAIRAACDAGQRLFGENRVQEFAEKAPALAGLDLEMHLIGHLQSNKAKKAAEIFQAVDSVDSLKLAEKLNASVETQHAASLPCLIEINIGGEEAKSGLPPDSPEFEELLLAAPRLDHLQFRGLMTLPPFTDDPEGARPYFRRVRELRDHLARRRLPAISLDVLSMGMSHDFEVAIAEGSTCVRLGTAIFGERNGRA